MALKGSGMVEGPVGHDEVADVLIVEIGEVGCADVGVHAMQVLGFNHIESAYA